ncbi:MAG: GvpL/GvpF family gas vesicle protein [Candidatus Theseobacter exili]|nr:GvpL/GvpF family gas vesicle protein [Candidatus Theseobacter exili]
METSVKEGKYIYCIMAAADLPGGTKTFKSLGIGGRDDEIYAVVYSDIAAVVSNSPIVAYSVSRENMIAHEKAIEEVMKEYTILPVRFCTIAKDEKTVKTILEKGYGKFKDMLTKIEGKKELGLKAVFNADAVYGDIVEKHKDIKRLKEKLKDLPADKTYYERVEIGRMVENALGEEREIYKDDILSALSPLAIETKTNNTYGEKMIVNAAFLVEKQRETEFDQKVDELGAKYGDTLKFKYVGTLPPFNFVNLIIETGGY